MAKRKPFPPPVPGEPLSEWAAKVAVALPPAELELAIRIYCDIANNRRLPRDDRRLARQQAEALKKSQQKS